MVEANEPSTQDTRDATTTEVERLLKVGVVWTVGVQVGLQVVRFLTVVVLARILSPDDYGTAALAVLIASYSAILGDLGYGGALVQARTTSERSISTAFWCSVASGVLGFAVAALAAYPASLALGEPAVAGLVIAGGSTLLIVALGSTSGALLTRALNFRVLQLVAFIAASLAALAAIAAALAGAGPWALATQQVVLACTATALLVGAARWRPSLSLSTRALKDLTRFAAPYTASAVFFVAYNLAAAILVGRFVGVEELGLWTIAMTVVALPSMLIGAPIAKVVFAAFSRMHDNLQRRAEVWLEGTLLLAALLLPALLGLAALAPDLVPFVLGDQWDAAVPIVQILCAVAITSSLVTWSSSVLDAAGKPYVPMAVNATIFLVLPLGILLGSRFGIEAVAVAYVIVLFACADVPILFILLRELALSPRVVLARVGRIMAAALIMLAAVLVVRIALDKAGTDVVVRLLASGLAGTLVYLGSLLLLAPAVARQLFRVPRNLKQAYRQPA